MGGGKSNKYELPSLSLDEMIRENEKKEEKSGVRKKKLAKTKSVKEERERKDREEKDFYLEFVLQLSLNLEEFLKENKCLNLKGDKEDKNTTMKMGRTYTSSPKEVVNAGIAYFKDCIDSKMPITMGGLAMQLKASRSQLESYILGDDKNKKAIALGYIISQLVSFVELYYETKAHAPNSKSQFFIFALKNLGWKDKVEIDDRRKKKVFTKDTVKDIQDHFKRLDLKKPKAKKKKEEK